MFPGEPHAKGERGPIDADVLLRQVLRRTLVYSHSMRLKHDDSADKTAELVGLSNLGHKVETIYSVEHEETELSNCFIGSPGWNRTNDQRINSPMLYR